MHILSTWVLALLLLASSSGLAWAPVHQPSLVYVAVYGELQNVLPAAEHKYRLPSGMLRAVWERECSRREICPSGADGERGPFQIKPTTAKMIDCDTENALCAARYIKRGYRHCGRSWAHALTYYNAGTCYSKPSEYGMDVYRKSLRGA